ncbi:MAG TPA: DUF4129 domain-containing protein [Noviherbaspirillum sp.]|nr:DUF4129 domain-containing protein [Noviherbaspirillum sp.]
MSASILYGPAYIGLYASQLLAITCNAYLDIGYGTFGAEIAWWAAGFAITLAIGRAQQGQVRTFGKWAQGVTCGLAFLLFLVVFIPTWGFPRAGLAMLAALQMSINCVTVSRRHLYLSLLVSTAEVMFAASHYRADWTMLFYMVPFIVAAVFTLVAEQVNSRIDDINAHSLGTPASGGQLAATLSATSVILLVATVLYLLTPQPVRPNWQWEYGQLTNIGNVKGESGQANQDTSVSPGSSAGASDGNQGVSAPGGWPSSGQMRAAAGRQGMPLWQANMILELADAKEWTEVHLQPLMQGLQQQMQSLKDWMKENYRSIAFNLLALILLLLAYGLWRFAREIKAVAWVITRFDYLRLGVLGLHGKGRPGAQAYFHAMERLLALHDAPRGPTMTAREYLAEVSTSVLPVRKEASEMTRLFEDHFYGSVRQAENRLAQMRAVYRDIFRSL